LNEGQHEKFARVTGYIVDLLNNKKLSTKTVIVDGEINTTQSGCPNVISGLTARPFWDTSNFPWIQALEDSYPDIKREFIALREQQQPDNCESEQAPSHFQHYRSPKSSTDISSTDSFTDGRQTSDHLGAIATSKGCQLIKHITYRHSDQATLFEKSGDWNVCYLHLHGVDFARNLEACPVTSEAIR
jgi:aspartyl/asparaginyl beta-hydroxylase (cupin superfamily)